MIKKSIVFVILLCLAGMIFGQEIGILEQLKSHLNQPVPANAQRFGRTEYYRNIRSAETFSFDEWFEVSNNLVIMAGIKISGDSFIVNRFFGEMFNILEPLGVPIIDDRKSAAWLNNAHLIVLLLTENKNNYLSEAGLHVFAKDDIELLKKIINR